MSKEGGLDSTNMAGRSATGGYDPSGIDLDEWEILESQLEESIPNYDRVNRLMTFGQDAIWRKNVRNHASGNESLGSRLWPRFIC